VLAQVRRDGGSQNIVGSSDKDSHAAEDDHHRPHGEPVAGDREEPEEGDEEALEASDDAGAAPAEDVGDLSDDDSCDEERSDELE